MAHEIGHLQGERHHNDPSDTPYEYVNTDEWATIMAGGDINEQRLNYWSNPNIAYGGDAMGTPADANNARVLNNTAKVLRDYRTLPSVSNFNFNNPSYTGSSPEFSWDPVPDASYYNVYKCKNDNGNIYDSCFNQTGGQFDSPTSFTDTGEIIKKSYHYGPCDGSSEAPAFYRVNPQKVTPDLAAKAERLRTNRVAAIQVSDVPLSLALI